MSAKSESLDRVTKALLRVKPGTPVDLHWPNDGGVETVVVLITDGHRVMVERIEHGTDEDWRPWVRREWLRPISQ